MTGRDGIKRNSQSRRAKARRRRVIGLGAGAGALFGCGMTGLATPPAAHADILDWIIDPIIQSVTDASTAAAEGASASTAFLDALTAIDPSAAADLGSLGLGTADTAGASGLDLGAIGSALSIDPLPAASTPTDSVVAAAAGTPTGADIPISVQEGTEPTVDLSVNGGTEEPVLVDTGSSGLVIPWQDIGLSDLETLGFPTGIGIGTYSGGVDYLYLTFDTSVDYGGILTTSDTPVDVEFLSWSSTGDAPYDFQQFAADNDVVGILGIGDSASDPGPSVSPLEAVGYDGVTVDVNPTSPDDDELVIGSNAGTPIASVSGAPISTLYESVDGGTPTEVSDDIDSGGVYGNIPSSLVSDDSVPNGTTISVYDSSSGGTPLYSYTVASDAPAVVSGTNVDSGVEPFFDEPIYINYLDDTLTFDKPGS